MQLTFLFRALSHRNFRLLFAGRSISLLGTWMQRTSLNWLLYRLSDSAFLLGLTAFCGDVGIVLLAPFAGVLADRVKRRSMLLTLQCLQMLQAFALAFLTLSAHIDVWQIMLLSSFLGLTTAFEMTCRQALMRDLVTDKQDLASAIALNSFQVNVARLLGGGVAGVVVAALAARASWLANPEGICFLVNAISFVPAIAALMAMRMPASIQSVRRPHVVRDLQEGFTYSFGSRQIRSLLLLLATVSFLGMPYSLLLPIFARDILRGQSATHGFLIAASAVGALAATFYLAPRKDIVGLEKRILLAAVLFGAGLIGFSFSRVVWLSCLILSLTGFAWVLQLEGSNAILQTIAAEDKRGRVMSWYALAFPGMVPLGSLLVGALASQIGAPHTLIVCGLGCIGAALLFAVTFPATEVSA